MALSNSLLNIKFFIRNDFIKKKAWFQASKPFFLPLLFIVLFIPVIYLLIFFKNEHFFYKSILRTLNKIHVSEKKLHATSAKEQLNKINKNLLKINPLSEEKKVLLTLTNELPKKTYEKMIHFFNQNQIILEEKNIIKHANTNEILYTLKKPIFIKTEEIETLINIVESDPNISFETFILSKDNDSINRLKLDFNLKIMTNNE